MSCDATASRGKRTPAKRHQPSQPSVSFDLHVTSEDSIRHLAFGWVPFARKSGGREVQIGPEIPKIRLDI